MTQEKDCNTCLHHVQGGTLDSQPPVCWDCSSPFRTSLPKWEPVPSEEVSSTAGKEASDGSSADYYKLPQGATQLQDLISHNNMNAQVGEMFRELYRFGKAAHCDELRGIKKVIFYANAELERLQKLQSVTS